MSLFTFDTALDKDLSGMNIQMNQIDLGSAQAKLYLFTPKIIPEQVLRSFKYDFTNELVNDLQGYDSFTKAVAPAGGGRTKLSINQAILPDTIGTPLNMNTFSAQWSFVLIVDDAGAFAGIRHAVQPPKTRVIATGYVVDEPVNRNTMWGTSTTENPNAILVFTHTSIVYLTNTMGGAGYNDNLQISHDADLVSEMNTQVSNQDMFVMTPYDLREATYSCLDERSGSKDFATAYGGLSLGNTKVGQPCRKIQSSLKSPKHHLADIMGGADSAIAACQGDFINSTILDSVSHDSTELFQTRFKEGVTGSYAMMPRHGLNTDLPMSIGELRMKYPTMQIQPFEIPNQSTWGVTPQSVMAKKTVMSSLVSATLSSLIPGSGLANISFRYSSWVKTDSFSSRATGAWEIQGFGTLTECSENTQMMALTTFKSVVEGQLFPILTAFGGEFDLMAYVNITGETLIDLNYLDETSAQLGEGFYETTNRLGGITNPNTATADIVNNNAFQLEKLVNQIGLGQFGPSSLTDNRNYNQSSLFNTNPQPANNHNNNGGMNNGVTNGSDAGYYL